MCEFCKRFDDLDYENKKLLDTAEESLVGGNVEVSMCISQGFLLMTVGNYDNAVRINYCPMCGKELKA